MNSLNPRYSHQLELLGETWSLFHLLRKQRCEELSGLRTVKKERKIKGKENNKGRKDQSGISSARKENGTRTFFTYVLEVHRTTTFDKNLCDINLPFAYSSMQHGVSVNLKMNSVRSKKNYDKVNFVVTLWASLGPMPFQQLTKYEALK